MAAAPAAAAREPCVACIRLGEENNCDEKCLFAKLFPGPAPLGVAEFERLHRTYRIDYLKKELASLDTDDQRQNFINRQLYYCIARDEDPIYGAFGQQARAQPPQDH